MNLCCKELLEYIKDKRNRVAYNNIFREYYIMPSNKGAIILLLEYCPWCGNKFPNSLRDEFFDTLENDYKLDLALDEVKNNPLIPPEFQSDEWWKKRGL